MQTLQEDIGQEAVSQLTDLHRPLGCLGSGKEMKASSGERTNVAQVTTATSLTSIENQNLPRGTAFV